MLALKIAGLFVNGISIDLARIALSYLSKFYGLDLNSQDPSVIKTEVKNAQAIFSLSPTGIIDEQLIKAIQTIKRCGYQDKLKLVNIEQARIINRWDPDQPVTYFVNGYVPGLSPDEQEKIFAKAWNSWEKYSPTMRVIRTDSAQSANIIIDASSSRAEEFGSVGNVLAWAQLPIGDRFRGKLLVKFDKAENWRTTSLDAVATHEFGHLWGLEHTNILNELMYPIYNPDVTSPQAKYDIPQFQLRYGSQTPPPPTADIPDIIVIVNNKRYPLGKAIESSSIESN